MGTLDLLVGLSEDLGKLDSFVEQVMKKVSNYLGDVLEDQRDKLSENLLANGGEILQGTARRWSVLLRLQLRRIPVICDKM